MLRQQVVCPTFVSQCDSLHGRHCLTVFQLQDASVVANSGGGEGLLQGCGDDPETAGLLQQMTLVLVLPGGLADLGSLRVQARELQLRGRVSGSYWRGGG